MRPHGSDLALIWDGRTRRIRQGLCEDKWVRTDLISR